MGYNELGKMAMWVERTSAALSCLFMLYTQPDNPSRAAPTFRSVQFMEGQGRPPLAAA